jgi:hypothetical protein
VDASSNSPDASQSPRPFGTTTYIAIHKPHNSHFFDIKISLTCRNLLKSKIIASLGALLGPEQPRPCPFYDSTISKLLDEGLKAAGTPEKWHSLLRHTVVDGLPLPSSQSPPRTCMYENGHYFQNFNDHILCHGLTVENSEHCYNHTARIYRNGKIVGNVNCFTLGHMPIEASNLKTYLKEWRGRSKEQPYWDEIDHKPVKK